MLESEVDGGPRVQRCPCGDPRFLSCNVLLEEAVLKRVSVPRTRFHRGRSGAGGAGERHSGRSDLRAALPPGFSLGFTAHMSQATNTRKWQERKLERN